MRAVLNIAGREPPNDIECEQAVLSACLTDQHAFESCRDTGLTGERFYNDAHRRIWDAACKVADEKQPVDITTIAAELKTQERLIAVGGISYLVQIVDKTPSVAHVEAHARLVTDLWRKRCFLDALSRAAGKAWMHKGSSTEMMGEAMAEIDVVVDNDDRRLVQAYDAVTARAVELQEQWEGKREAHGIPCQLPGLHDVLRGWRRTALYLLAATTGGGKSSAALQEALGIAGITYANEKIGAVYISLEMPVEEIVDRAFAIESGVPDEVIQTGDFTDEQADAFQEGSLRVSQKPLWFYTSPVDVATIRALIRKADREMRTHGEGRRVRFVVVDYLGLMELEDASRHDIALADTARALKLVAMELDVVIIALCQFNRGNADRDPWDLPQLRDLKDSSGLEQNANGVVFIHRVIGIKGAEDYAAINVAKSRKGGTGTVLTKFNGKSYRFELPHAADLARWRELRESATSKPRRRKR